MEFSVEFLCASVFTVICILLAFVYRYVCKLYTYFDKLDISGPVPSFLIGTWKEAHEKFLGDTDFENAKLYGKVYGTFDGLTPNLMVIEPEIIKQILLTHADKFNDRRAVTCKNSILKKSLTSLYGEEDREVQALTNSLLSDSKIGKLLPRLNSSANSLIQNIIKIKEEDGALNLISIVNEYIHDVIAFVVFGIDLNSDVSFKDEFIGHCDKVFYNKNPNSRLSVIPFLCESLGDSWIVPQKTLDYFVDLIKSAIKAAPRDPVLTEGKAANFIELLVEACEEEKKLVKREKETENGELVLTEEFIISKSVSVILSLINSTKSTILLTIHSLANQQEVQEELSSEIEKNKTEKLSMADFQNLQLLDMVIAEVLRLYPSEFRLEKVSTEPVTIDKFNFETGSRVSIPLYALHRHPDYYTDQEKFDPRRFSQEAIENRNPFTYLPFGQVGINSYSISVQLALLASKITLFKLVEKFKFKVPEGGNTKAIFQKGITGVPKLYALNVTTEVKSRVHAK